MTRHELWLGGLTLLFAVRVVAQLLQRFFDLTFLPPFEAWHGGLLPYWLLLSAQIVLLGMMIGVVRRVARNRLDAARGKAVALLALGSLYLATMSFRLVAGQTFLGDNVWFAAPLPASFHIVLALFVILLGHYHAVTASRKSGTASP